MEKMNIIHLRGNHRIMILRYLKIKTAKKLAEAKEKKAKADAQEALNALATAYKTANKTAYLGFTVTDKKEEKAVVYKETTAQGSIDWEAYALDLGGTAEGAEAYRKDSNTRTAIDWATEKQAKEILEAE